MIRIPYSELDNMPASAVLEAVRQYNDHQVKQEKRWWETARLAGFIPASMWSEEVRKPTDILSFPWENVKDNKRAAKITVAKKEEK